ncbi:rnapii degradation factor def1 [Trichophyton violaceum]|uniref:RNA polymerase II degradation factor 1 n=1 Tax=Trichophyton violaceum TaxID=34388 RepID=A0A178FQM6_TRIVO|nr:rnapii degradation factor def1 [Trichophyton violaceum]
MSEVQSRPSASRGRGSARGGRGGHISRGGRGGARSTAAAKPAAASQETAADTSHEDEGEIGQLKKKYAASLSTIKELFADWTDEDLVFALEDANGDLEVAIERITEGNVSQWGEVKKKSSDRTRQKASSKDAAQHISGDQNIPPSRPGRGRGGFDQRGRGRGDRGRGGRGGRAGSHAVQSSQANGTTSNLTPVDGWDSNLAVEPPAGVETSAVESKPQPEWNTVQETPKVAVEQSTQKSSLIPEGSKRGWASLFAKPAPEPVKEPPLPTAPSAPEKPAEAPVEPSIPEPAPTAAPEPELLPNDQQQENAEQQQQQQQQPPAAPAQPQIPVPVPKPVEQPRPVIPQQPPAPPSVSVPAEPEAPAQPDTESPADIEKESVPQQKQQQQQQQQPQARTPATSYAYPKGPAAGTARGPNFQRRVMEQQEPVVMPGNHAVDRATVQFGSMGLNGSTNDVNIDEKREEPETRPQPPQHSPVAPRASLPPTTRPVAVPETTATVPRPAPGLPPAPVASADTQFNDFSRYGDAQKPYDIFNQQADQQAQQPQSQEPFSNQGIPSQPAAVTTAADYSAFYGADQSRNPYYYSAYGQPQDPAASQRVGAGFAASGAESQPQVPASQPPGRYAHAEAPNSGQNTPQPVVPGQVQSAQQPSHHMPQSQGAHAGFNYGYPYYTNPHYPNAYMNQMTQHQQHQYGRNRPMYDDARRYEEQQQQQQQQQQQHYLPHQSQYAYGTQYAPYGKGGMYSQQPQQHGFGYESSPANTAAFNQSAAPQRDTATYGRAGSAQPADGQQQQSTGANAFSGIPDVFGRTQSGFGQNQPIPSQQATSADETGSSKAYDSSKTGGPSPSVSQVNRPGSAANNAPHQPATTGQSGLPPVPAAQQANQQAFGGYPHLNQQYGGLGGLGAHQAGTTHQATAYNNYGAGFGSNYYGNNGRGGGWGGNYGH